MPAAILRDRHVNVKPGSTSRADRPFFSRGATLEERLNWHVLHEANCDCRKMPESIRRELEARGMNEPTPNSLK